MGFKLHHSTPLKDLNGNIELHVNEKNGLKAVFAEIPGPLTSMYILLPTEPHNNKGIPHCLEHLVFMSSDKYPRGYLDQLAMRCLTPATNAFTSDDLTCYYSCFAGSEGVNTLLPVFMDHVFNPQLTEEQFLTEIYHIDEKGKQGGVVFCEMQARENSEMDLLWYNIKAGLFPNSNLIYETGGLTPEIAQLSLEEIQEYHSQYYRAENATIVIIGSVDKDVILKTLDDFQFRQHSVPAKVSWKTPIPPMRPNTKTVAFPSSDLSVGSVAVGWRAPAADDIETWTAIDVLVRFFADTSSSPFAQTFVELKEPLASSVDFGDSYFAENSIELYLSGVPFVKDSEDESDDESDDESGNESVEESEEESEEEEDNADDKKKEGKAGKTVSSEEKQKTVLLNGVILETLDALVDKLARGDWAVGDSTMPQLIAETIDLQEASLLEQYEDSPHDSIQRTLFPDLLYRVNVAEPHSPSAWSLGAHLNVLPVLETLRKKPFSYWTELIRRLFVTAPRYVVTMTPDAELAKANEQKALAIQAQNVATYGEDTLEAMGKRVKDAVAVNTKQLSPADRARLPQAPSPSTIRDLPFAQTKHAPLTPANPLPFPVLAVASSTHFVHAYWTCDTSHFPAELRPYLFLLQELLLESGLAIPSTVTDDLVDSRKASKRSFSEMSQGDAVTKTSIPYSECVRLRTRDILTSSTDVGFDNDGFSCATHAQMFNIYLCAETKKQSLIGVWLRRILFHTVFDAERIRTICKNSISDIADEMRDGNSCLSALSTVQAYGPESAADANDVHISFLKQRRFLAAVLEKIKADEAEVVISRLNAARALLLRNFAHCCVSVSHPSTLPLAPLLTSLSTEFTAGCYSIGLTSPATAEELPPHFLTKISLESAPKRGPEPINTCALIPGVDSTFLQLVVPCEVHKRHSDYFPLLVASKMVSCLEGAYTAQIRGQGLAYGSSVQHAAFWGELWLRLYRCSDPAKAVAVFFDLVHGLKAGGPSVMVDAAMLQNVKAEMLFDLCQARATPYKLFKLCVQWMFLGYSTPEEALADEARVHTVTQADIKAAMLKYFSRLTEPQHRLCVLTSGPKAGKQHVEKLAGKADHLSPHGEWFSNVQTKKISDYLIPATELQ